MSKIIAREKERKILQDALNNNNGEKRDAILTDRCLEIQSLIRQDKNGK